MFIVQFSAQFQYIREFFWNVDILNLYILNIILNINLDC